MQPPSVEREEVSEIDSDDGGRMDDARDRDLGSESESKSSTGGSQEVERCTFWSFYDLLHKTLEKKSQTTCMTSVE